MDDDSWTPPTEAERKEIHVKRERSDKISHIMGQYLLRGYKMLSATCPQCATILLQDRNNKYHCVGCSEVDNEQTKAEVKTARKQSEESGHSSSEVNSNDVETESVPKITTGLRTIVRHEHSNGTEELSDTRWLEKAERQLRRTLETTTNDLSCAHGVDECIRYCTLIKASAEALLVLKSLKNATN